MAKRYSDLIEAILVAFVLFLVAGSMAKAYDAPDVYVKEASIKQESYNEGGAIEGDFLIWNSENVVESGLAYSISLKQGRNDLNKKMFFVSEPIGPNKELKQNFSYSIPKIFPSGEYEFNVQIFSQSGFPLGWKNMPVKVNGTGMYLNISDSAFIKDEKKMGQNSGASYDPNASFKIKFKTANLGTKKVDFAPIVAVYSSFENPNELKKFTGEKYSLSPKEFIDVELSMPKFEKPGAYVAKVILADQGVAVSKEEYFNWNIKGESVKILNVSIGSMSLQSGKDVKIGVDFIGAVDKNNIGESKLSVNIFDSKTGKNIGSAEKMIRFGPAMKTEVLSLAPLSSADKFWGEVKIVKNGKELALYDIGWNDQAKKQEQQEGDNLIKLVLSFFAAIAIIVLFILTMRRYRKGLKVSMFLVLLCSGLFVMNLVNVYAAAFSDLTLILTKILPLQDMVVNYGDAITYQGSVSTVDIYGGSQKLEYVTDVDITTSVCGIDTFNCVTVANQKNNYVVPNGSAYNTSDSKLYVLDGDLQKMGWIYGHSRILKVDPVTKRQEGILDLGGTELAFPQDIFYASPYLFVADTWNNRIVRFDPANIAATMQIYSNSGTGGVDFSRPQGIFYSAPYLFVADSDPITDEKRVIRMNIGAGTWDVYALPSLSSIGDVAFDQASSYVYVTDPLGNRIAKFDVNNMAATLGEIVTDSSGEVLTGPVGIIYSSPYLYVADSGAGRIVRINPSAGSPWTIFGTYGAGSSQFDSPSGILYYNSNVYVSDGGNDRLAKFDPSNMAGTWNVYDFAIDSYNINANIPAYFNPGFKLANGTTDRDVNGNIAPERSFYAKIEMKYDFEDGEFKNIDSLTRIKLNNTAVITPVVCKLYGVTDTNSDDTGIITIDQNTGKVIVLSEFNDGDIENLDIHPVTNYIYVATDQSDDYAHGSLFIVNGLTGALTPPAGTPTGLDGIVALSFRPTDNTLWVWSKQGGQGNNRGLSKIVVNNENIVSISNEYPSSIQVEGLAWSNDGSVLYASSGDKLYEYDPVADTLTQVADNLPGPAEGLDTRSDGYLYVGKHRSDTLYIYDPVNHTNEGSLSLSMDASSAIQVDPDDFDVEGLAWPGGCSFNLPTANNLNVVPAADFCTMPGYTFQWTFSDSDVGDVQGRYRLVADTDPAFNTPTVDIEDSPTVVGNNFQVSIPVGYGDDASLEGSNQLAYGATYYWKIMVWDNNGAASSWISPVPATFSTEEHRWPDVGFTPVSASFPYGVSIPFYAGGTSDWDSSYCYINPWAFTEPCSAWNWDFCNGEACSNKVGTGESINHTYPIAEIGAHEVLLTVQDSNGHACSYPNMYLIDPDSVSAPWLNLNPPQPIDYCTEDLPQAVALRWEFDDAEDGYGNQTAFEIELGKYDSAWNLVANCNPGKQGSPAVPDNRIMLSGTDINGYCPGFISYGGYRYRWKLRVFDSDDNVNVGGFKNGVDFPSTPTPNHEFPRPLFTYTPNAGLIQFMDITFDPSSSFVDPDLYVKELEWIWGDGSNDLISIPVSPGVDLGQTKIHAYTTVGSKTVDLRIKDSDGSECWASDRGNERTFNIGTNKPKWDETVP